MLCYHQGTLHFQTLYSSLLSRFMGHVWLICARAVLCNEMQLLYNTTITCLVLNVLFQAAQKKGQGYALKTIWTLLSLKSLLCFSLQDLKSLLSSNVGSYKSCLDVYICYCLRYWQRKIKILNLGRIICSQQLSWET